MIHKNYKKKNFVESCVGAYLPESDARYLDSIIKDCEKEAIVYKHKFIVKQEPDLLTGERADVSYITTQDVDRDNEIVLSSGADIQHYEKNSIVTWNHDYSKPPVGRAAWLKFMPEGKRNTSNAIKAKTIYAEEGTFKLADIAWNLVRQRILNGKSIGYIPLPGGISPPTQKEVDTMPFMRGVSNVIRKYAIFEYAVATVPANQNALVEQVAKGDLVLPDDVLEDLGVNSVEELIQDAVADVEEQKAIAEPEPIPMPQYVKSWDQFKKDIRNDIYNTSDLIKKLKGRL